MNAPTSHDHLIPQVSQREVPQALLDALAQRFGANCSTAQIVREQHGRDESAFTTVPPPAAVVFAQSTQDVADAVALAAKFQTPVIPFGVGSSLEGQLLAVQGGISLDVGRMNRVLSVNAEDLTVTVQPGVTRKQLNEEIKSTGLFFPIDPGADASIGGMCATRASGTNAVRYGTMRENVLALEVVTASGQVIRTGTRAKKSSAGYDLTRLMVGSEGTLGVITEVSLKVLSFAPCEATLVCDLAQAPALDLLQRWGGQPLPLNASCWVHDAVGGAHGGDKLFVRLRGAVAAVQAAIPRMCADVVAVGGQASVMDNAQAGPDWAAARDQRLPFFSEASAPDRCLWRLSVAQTAPVLDLPYATFIEWHGGQRWVWAPAAAAAQLHELAQRNGGHATLFRRPAGALADTAAGGDVFAALDATQARIQTALQHQFDPDGVFNTRRNHASA